MSTGKIVWFNEERGFGFVASADGSEDAFIDTSQVMGDCSNLCKGKKVFFEAFVEKGLKTVSFISEEEK